MTPALAPMDDHTFPSPPHFPTSQADWRKLVEAALKGVVAGEATHQPDL